jgi:putative membrane-bound dehydrogenase-like protein
MKLLRLIVLLSLCALPLSLQAAVKNIVLIAGKPSHGPGEHEHRAGCLLFEKCLASVPGINVKVYDGGWPTKVVNGAPVDDDEALASADAIVIYADGGSGHPMLQGNRLAVLDELQKKGVGLGFIHYAIEPTKERGEGEMISWVGGAFEIDWSVNPVWEAKYTDIPDHEVTRGVHPFSDTDEWYFNMQFRADKVGVTPVLSAVPPDSTMSRKDGQHEGNRFVRAQVAEGRKQHMMWVTENKDGSRGFGFTGGHYHKSWANDDKRKIVLNAILWIAKVAVPENGVESSLKEQDVASNLDPKPKPKPKSKKAGATVSAPVEDPNFIPTNMFKVPEGFEVTLWAKSPMLQNPTNMDIDEKGRIWVTEGVNYRRHSGRDPKGDRVVMLEDTTSRGFANKATTFVQEPWLVAPLGIAVIDDQVIVSNAPDLIVYTNHRKDGKFDPSLDKRDVLLTGFNGRNHDHSLHSVTFGPDGLYYFNQGNTGAMFTDRSGKTFRVGDNYEPGTPFYSWKPSDIAGALSDDGHVYVGGFSAKMNPDGTHVEVIGFNYRNSYEQCVTSFGDVFQNDNDDPPACRTSFVMEYGNAGFFSRDGKRGWSADRRPGQTIPIAEWRQEDPGTMPVGDVYGAGSPTGIVAYEGDLFGEQYRGMILSADAARNTLMAYFPKADGAGYDLKHIDFLTTNVEQKYSGVDTKGQTSTELKTWFRPSDVTVGPDGAIYFTDWFDPRVGGHADFDSKLAGSIYRLAPKGFKSVVPKIDLSTTEGQLLALKSPAVNVRASGFLRLKAKGADSVEAVATLLADSNPYIRARAVWLLAQLGAQGVARVEALLTNSDPLVRVTAYRSLRQAGCDIFKYAESLTNDSSAAVRREVALSLRDKTFEQSKSVLLKLAQRYDGTDRAYLEAWGTGCSGKEESMAALLYANSTQADSLKWSTAYAKLIWRLTPNIAAVDFAKRAASSSLSVRERLDAVTALGFMPTKEASDALLDLAQNGKDPVKLTAFWWLLHYKNSRWNDFGVEKALKALGMYDPDTLKFVSMVVPDAPKTQLSVPAIAKLSGDVKHGRNVAQACMACHMISGEGTDYAPDLTGFAKRQTKEVVIESIVYPSQDISQGYDGTELKLTDGTVIDGLQLTTGDPIIIKSMTGLTQLIPANKVKLKRGLGSKSLMLSADQLGLSAQDLADVVAYLQTQG